MVIVPPVSYPLAKWNTKKASVSIQRRSLPSSAITAILVPISGRQPSMGSPRIIAAMSNTAGPTSSTRCRSVSTKS